MYTEFFGLRENPFSLTPDPRFLFLSPTHEEALEHLLYGIRERKGFVAVTGGIGTGKTTLCRTLLGHLDENTRSALIFNPFLSDRELLETVRQEFGIPAAEPPPGPKKDHLDALNLFLLQVFRGGGNAVLIIDEAQHLSPETLEQVRMLSNLETEQEKLLQIVLVGQPELQALLSAPALKQLDERITVRCELKPLTPRDARQYIEHRLAVAGGADGRKIFSAAALRRVARCSEGIPRRINALCDRALLAAFARGKDRVSGRLVRAASAELSRPGSRAPRFRGIARALTAGVLLAALAAGILLALERLPPQPLERILSILRGPEPANGTDHGLPPDGLPALEAAASVAALFELQPLSLSSGLDGRGRDPLGLVTFQFEPQFLGLLKRPFRVRLAAPSPGTPARPRFLVVRRTTVERFVALDAAGREHPLSRDELRQRWGGEVSWLYPFPEGTPHLVRGMQGPGILEAQRVLRAAGYLVEPSGVFDEDTFQEVAHFQRDFGLKADGILGPRTRALLYQMEDGYEFHSPGPPQSSTRKGR